MPRLVYWANVSLDGFIAGPHGEGDWVLVDEEFHQIVNAQQREEVGAYLYGTRMYELMSGAWPHMDEDPSAPSFIAEFAAIWRGMPKVVFSHTLEAVDWNARLVHDDAAREVARLRAEPGGKDLMVGGSELASSLARAGLIDEYQLVVHPVVLGGGQPIPRTPVKLRLAGPPRTLGSGVVMLRYERP